MAKQHTKQQVRAKIRWGIFGIFVLLLIALAYDGPMYANRAIDKVNNTVALGIPRLPEEPFALGLDLQGGAHLIYEANTKEIDPADRPEAVEGVRDVIERRVNGIGVGEPNVQTSKVGETYRVLVELPGVTDVNAAIAMIGETPILEFREENNVQPRDLTEEEQKQIDTYNVDASKRAGATLARISGGESFEDVAKDVSEDEKSKVNGGYIGFVSEKSIYPEIFSWSEKATEGDITKKVVETDGGYEIVKRGGSKGGDMQTTASHILICYLGAKDCSATLTKQEALAEAERIYGEANAGNFADLAKENSTEPGAEVTGGSLGTFGPGAMVPAFEEALNTAKAGEIIGPVETEYGYHIIYKESETPSTEYEISLVHIRKLTATDVLPFQDPWMPTQLSGKNLDRAEVVTDSQTGQIQVSLLFDSEGTALFRDITERNINKQVAIFLDGSIISAPVVQTIITDGRAVITGGFDLTEARILAQRLNAGALPVPVDLVSQQTVGASLGAASFTSSVKAGIAGIIFIMMFMMFFYRLPGIISIAALMVYIAVSLALMKLIGVTLTLAGIAGFILSIGMAVDANVLIFERMKEELRDGKSLKGAVEEGFLRAWTSIRDGNISTLITCGFLMFFGSSFVKGFAITLSLGILVSLFSAITVTRIMLRFVVPWFKERGNVLFLGAIKNEEA
ncbi:MAG: protein translocase subunit SecD [Candidatus Magasanikbacteria bacterium CG_4_9_14_0_2_um_filter_41_10]|uniref:Protein translocase subunit SecD n=1 Tax=Candidatus Magasanikbacteria bacterium CG_4_10_14_0_2_um_filter_41_31 TaxID=1974639 RepID=A0A2M7V4Y6_9BACT|nr:MAG: protein-export membrane protein SecD [Candidatus Magasanikbacteria bacterium CG1_02_41_34]PIZ93642.1 MAG: protein translocase subunit SecD [Candidatus Magasanikbacteria bacterium CG_4_10_14_0_2_um_filter_41_31]PJC53764.1 MAG: protein translocase subunit SecD [Candidatus Magasanikbacteria bacterium CG_4_9_14_0_2_um_filter_41_10]